MNNNFIKIGNTKVGPNKPTFIIAEAGVNHNGDLSLAKKLIIEAKNSGADCIKFQTFKAERIATMTAPKAAYQLALTNPEESQLEMLKKLEMPEYFYDEIINCCKENNIMFLSTPYNEEDVDFLDSLEVPAFKLASISSVEPHFASYVSKKNKPIIMSTGMSTIGELDNTIRSIKKTNNDELILLQCSTNYPSMHRDSNLLAIETMRRAFNLQVGYSDHTTDDTTCIMSIAFGATVIEKHLTLDKNLPGPDHKASYEPKSFTKLVQNIRNAEKCLGTGLKEPSKIEIKNSKNMRRSIFSKQDIIKGTLLTDKMITLKRPANGIPARHFRSIINRRAKNNISKDQLISWEDLN